MAYRSADYDRARRAKTTAAGLCSKCRKRPVDGTSTACRECLDANETRRQAWRKAHTKAGRCECGGELTVIDDNNCLVCLERKAVGQEWRA